MRLIGLPLLLLFLAATAGPPQGRPAAPPPTPEPGPSRYVLLKLTREPAQALTSGGESTGLASLDQLDAELGARFVRKIFRDPPRGHADPDAWQEIGLGRWVHVEFDGPRADIETLVDRYSDLPCVEQAFRDRYIYPAVIPDDPDYLPNQWDLHPDRCDGEGAWDTITDSSDLLVFVIDTGCEITHSDIAGNIWQNPGEIPGNGVDDDLNGYIDDVNGWDFVNNDNTVEDDWPHGIHVNGIIGAMGNNAHKVTGINWTCRLAQAKIYSSTHGTDEFGAQGTVYAADNGASVTNNSWGDTQPVGPIHDALIYADGLDVLQVAAAGNNGSTDPFYPAVFPEMLSVASTNSSDQLSSWSNHGDWLDMSAPGESIWNLWVGDSTTWLSGTSMACPHVSGAGALVRAANRQLANFEARWVLDHASDDLGTPGFDSTFGWGRLDIHQAVDTARSLSLSSQTVNAGDSVTIDLEASSEAGMMYIMLAGRNGIDPGMALTAIDPAEARLFPLNWDDWMSWQLSINPNPITRDFVGFLDGSGQAQATLVTLPIPFFQARTFTFAYLTLDPADLSHVRFISAPLHVEVQ